MNYNKSRVTLASILMKLSNHAKEHLEMLVDLSDVNKYFKNAYCINCINYKPQDNKKGKCALLSEFNNSDVIVESFFYCLKHIKKVSIGSNSEPQSTSSQNQSP